MILTLFITAAVLAALVVFRFYNMGDTAARHQARADYERLREENPKDVLVSVDQETFVNIYDDLRVRRFWLHLGIFFVLAAGLNFVLFAVLQLVWRVIDPGFYVWGFIAFFATIALAVIAFFITMRFYTSGRLPAMRKAIEAWKASNKPDQK